MFIIQPPNVPRDREGEYQKTAEQIAGDGRGSLPNGSDVKTVTAGSDGVSVFVERLRYYREEIVLAGTGGILTTLDGEAGLGKGAAEEHDDTWLDIAADIAVAVSECLQEGFDAPLLDRLYPGEEHLAYFELEKPVRDKSPSSLLTDAKAAKDAGFDWDAEDLAEQTGYKITKSAAQISPDGTGIPINGAIAGQASAPAAEAAPAAVTGIPPVDTPPAGGGGKIPTSAQGEAEAQAGKDAARGVEAEGQKGREKSAADDANSAAADRGDVKAIDQALAAKRAELAKAREQVARVANEAEGEVAGEAVNKVQDEIAALEKLRVTAQKAKADAEKKSDADAKKQGEENDKLAIEHLQGQAKLVEELGRQRIGLAERAGGTEESIARKRMAIEADIATKRLELENKIGLLQGETAEDRKAREAAFRADAIERENALAKLTRDAARQRDADAWSRDRRDGRLDARTQRSYGTGGDLAEEHGVLQPGYTRDRLGVISGPSMLYQMTGPGWGGQSRRTTADLLPQAQAPAAGSADRAGSAQSPATAAMRDFNKAADKMLSDLVAAAKSARATIEKKGGEAVKEIHAIEEAVETAGKTFNSTVKDLSQKVSRITRGA